MAVLRSEEIDQNKHDCSTASQAEKQARGCDGPLPECFQWEYAGHKFSRCARHYIKDAKWLAEAFEIYNWRTKGFLPFPGSYLDQPNAIVEACNLIDQLVLHKQQEEISRMSKKQIQKPKGPR